MRWQMHCDGGIAAMLRGAESIDVSIDVSIEVPRGCACGLSQRSPCNVHVWLVLRQGVELCHALSGLHPPHAGRVGSLSAGQAGGRGAAVRRGRGARRAAGSKPFYPLEEFAAHIV